MTVDLLAGDPREILLVLALEDEAIRDHGALDAHLSVPAWVDGDGLDAFAAAVRDAAGSDGPAPFADACTPFDGPDWAGGRSLARLDPAWLAAVASVADDRLDAVAARWRRLLEGRPGLPTAPLDEAATRVEAARIVEFARLAAGSPAVLLARAP